MPKIAQLQALTRCGRILAHQAAYASHAPHARPSENLFIHKCVGVSMHRGKAAARRKPRELR